MNLGACVGVVLYTISCKKLFFNGKEKGANKMQLAIAKQNANVESIKMAIASKIDSAGFAAWVMPLQFEIVNNYLHLVAHNQFSADHVKRNYGNIIQNVAADFCLELKISVRANMNVNSANDNVVCEYSPEKNIVKQNKRDAFDDFVTCDDNMFAVAACKKMASNTASFSQLFICGAAGAGKTLLANCICATSNKRVVMMSGGQFVSDFARSLRDKTIFSFKDYCRNCDMFIMDDVCALAGKRATMDEFLQLLTDLRESGKSVVLTANAAPNALTGFDRRMQSLFASGLVVDVVAPNVYVRRSMLKRAGVDSVVADELAKQIGSDGHLVNGVINKIKTYTELMGETVDMDVAARLLGDVLNKNKTPTMMVKSMCEKMCVSYDEICGNSRTRRLVRARQIMMAVLKSVTNLSLTEIGNICGGRDHATVVYALSQIENQKASDLMLSAEIDSLIKICK